MGHYCQILKIYGSIVLVSLYFVHLNGRHFRNRQPNRQSMELYQVGAHRKRSVQIKLLLAGVANYGLRK